MSSSVEAEANAAAPLGSNNTRRFVDSALSACNGMIPTTEFHCWLADRLGENSFETNRIPFDRLSKWKFDASTENLVHADGRFFTVEGLQVETNYGAAPSWHQPIINQAEVGILGILVKEIDGVLHCLMSAKMEPGNVNVLQLSPTVQATRSNYTQAHRGSVPPYVDYFLGRGRGRVLVDVLQSEQGSWFYRKRNRNMVVEVQEEVPVLPDFCWLTLGQVLALLRQDNIVNMDTRTVLSCIPFHDSATGPELAASEEPFRQAVARSLSHGIDSSSISEAVGWFEEAKARYRLRATRVPLSRVDKWYRTDTEIAHQDGKYFAVIAVSVSATNREVASWTQPMIEPREQGEIALLVKRIGGVLHGLVHARVEAGYKWTAEIAPTVQCSVANYQSTPSNDWPPFLDDVLTADPETVRYESILSEEGGRFYQAQNRYRIIEVHEDFAARPPSDFRWMTLGQLGELLRSTHFLNIQARSLVASLHSLWALGR
ncbi:dTDP-4-dehydro-6-deoxy-alpha-D-glucopyranose 2,3-dehydratase SpnO [Saccharopolyspora spinosa]|uniref:dTDP-4-dehydro-6-deoxy-alpha-D-glucopyranose 2,3-dehydratase SpnO n=1 Tax=Saccharopolyspora spinosa TaxID=60894 RepID=UPI0016592A58|nr:dTDP-4-dehydro-6-deoxy-alpha-D-glucopyranose 2,3-dehydratase SpnO [Saccharopolyspora spinosa]